MTVKSGIQKEVLALYRSLLRESIKKDRSTSTSTDMALSRLLLSSADSVTRHVTDKFRKDAYEIDRKDFRTIEYRIRHGYKQIKLLQMPGVKTFQSTSTSTKG